MVTMIEYAIDPDTGLPNLPENYFWRVSRVSALGVAFGMRVELRRKWFGPFSEHMRESGWFDPTDTRYWDNPKQAIAVTARGVWQDWRNDNALQLAISTYTGDYPPKKLEAK